MGGIHYAVVPLETKQSKFQRIDIVEMEPYGNTLILDGKIQSTSVDEFVYHENLVHVSMLTHPNPQNVLVLGGGEGATIREVFKHKTVKKCVMVDLDPDVVDMCKKHLPDMSAGAFGNRRLTLLHEDARKYIETTDEKFDVILSDVTDPLEGGTTQHLFSQEFFSLAKKVLNKNGLVTIQSTAVHPNLDISVMSASVRKTMAKVFKRVCTHTCFMYSFALEWSFTTASDTLDPSAVSENELEKRIRSRVKGKLRYMSASGFRRAVSLPSYLKDVLQKGKIIKDNEPLFAFVDRS